MYKKIIKLLMNLDTKKDSQDKYIATRIIEENYDLLDH